MIDNYTRIKGDYIRYLKNEIYKDRQFTLADPPWEFDDEPRHFGIDYTRWESNIVNLVGLAMNINTPLFFLWSPVALSEEVFRAMGIHNQMVKRKQFWLYKSRFTWRKITKNGKVAYGTGHWARNSVEDLFIFAKPNQKPIRLNMRNSFDEEYFGNTHKPRTFEYTLIKELYERGVHKGVYLFSGKDRLEFFQTYNVHLVDIDMPEFDLELENHAGK